MCRKTIILSFAVFITTLVMTGVALAIPMVNLSLSDSNIVVGDTFTLDVFATDVTDIDPFLGQDEILSFGFDVIFNSTEFTFNGATVDAPFFDDSMLFPNSDVAGSIFPGMSGDSVSLASLSFTANTSGNFSLGILSDLLDLNEGLSSWIYGPLDMTQSLNVNVNPVPEPATLLLFSASLASLGIFRKRTKY